MKFVVLTNGNWYGYKLSRELSYAKVKHSVVIPKTGNKIRDILKFTNASMHVSYKTKVRMIGEFNTQEMENCLKKINPDFILLGGIGILKQHIINTAKFGVVNAHPGLLPWFRNVGVVGRALQEGYPVGSTLHYVDSGIDTGGIITRHKLGINPSWDLSEIEKQADFLSISILVNFARTVVSAETVDKETIYHFTTSNIYNNTTIGENYTWLSKKERDWLDMKVLDGLAYNLQFKEIRGIR